MAIEQTKQANQLNVNPSLVGRPRPPHPISGGGSGQAAGEGGGLRIDHPSLAAFNRDRFLLKQKHLSLSEKYVVFDEQDQQILFIHRPGRHLGNLAAAGGGVMTATIIGAGTIMPAMAIQDVVVGPIIMVMGALLALVAGIAVAIWLSPKRHISFYLDQSMQTEVLKVYQDSKWVFLRATYTVADADFNLLGWFSKNYIHNIFRKRWYVHGPGGELLCVCKEDSLARALLRRVMQAVIDMPLMRTNFVLLKADQETRLGEFNRQFTLLDKYVLDMSADGGRTFDRRLALALGVMLDTGERR